MMEGFKATLIVMAFYSVAITLIAYAIPDTSLNYVTSQEISGFRYQDLGNKMEDSLTKQTNLPIIDLAALVFFSGNILMDLLINFMYAIPQMLGLLISIITGIFNFDSGIVLIVETFTSIIITSLYVVGVIQMVVGIRSQSGGIL